MPGSCKSKLKRYYYNKTINMCHEFTYSGCEGNSNNFEDEVSCRSTCKANEIGKIIKNLIIVRKLIKFLF